MEIQNCTLCPATSTEDMERVSWEGEVVTACFECCCALGVV